MAVLLDLAQLLVQETKETIYAKALQIAEAVGLPVTSWQPGDPTRSDYHVLSEILATLEEGVVDFISAGFLDHAAERAKETGNTGWLKLAAKQDFNVDANEATFATTDELLFNSGGGLYTISAGDLTFENSTTGKTYRNTSGGTLNPSGGTTFAPGDVNTSTNTISATNALADGDAVAFSSTGGLPGGLSALPTYYYVVNRTVSSFKVSTTVGGAAVDITSQGTGTHKYVRALKLSIKAEEAGSDSNAAAGEIDSLVTSLLNVTCTNPTTAVAIDEEEPDEVVKRCRRKLSSLSPNGPPGAYEYVATTDEDNGTEIGGIPGLRVRVYPDSDTGDVTVYLADADGAVSGADRDQVEEAILTWATPLTITPTVLSASAVVVPVTYQLWIYEGVNKTEQEVKDAVQDALEDLFAELEIGGDIVSPATTGKLYQSLIVSVIRNTFPTHAFRVSVTSPAGDTDLTNSQVATLGTVTPTITFEDDP